jgi:hypothetical protein
MVTVGAVGYGLMNYLLIALTIVLLRRSGGVVLLNRRCKQQHRFLR